MGVHDSFRRRATFALLNIGMHSWCVDSRIAVSLPPWVDLGKYIDCNIQLTDGICVSVQFMDMITHKYDKYECIYTDGSKCEETNSVSSAVFLACSSELHSWKLDPMHSVLGSELHAIQMAIDIVGQLRL